MNKKGFVKIKALAEGELEDYGYFTYDKIEHTESMDDEHYFTVNVKSDYGNKEKELFFKYNSEEDKIYIELGEDAWNELTDYDYRIKYFWMALLKWEI